MIRSKEENIERRKKFAALTRNGFSMSQIAKEYGITRQAVSLILKKAVQEGEIVCKSRANIKDSSNYKIVSRKKQVKCIECGSYFPNQGRKTCSKECFLKRQQKNYGGEWSRIACVNLICNNCGKEFKRSKYISKINEHKRTLESKYYCSRDCYCNRITK